MGKPSAQKDTGMKKLCLFGNQIAILRKEIFILPIVFLLLGPATAFARAYDFDWGIHWYWPFLFIVPLIFIFTWLSGGYDLNQKKKSGWGWKNYDYVLLAIFIFFLGIQVEASFYLHRRVDTTGLGPVVTFFLLYALFRSIQIHSLLGSSDFLHPVRAKYSAIFLSVLAIMFYLSAFGTDGSEHSKLNTKLVDSYLWCDQFWADTDPKNECTMETLAKNYKFELFKRTDPSQPDMKINLNGNKKNIQIIGYYPRERRAYKLDPKLGSRPYEINDSNEILEGSLDKFLWNVRVNLELTKERE